MIFSNPIVDLHRDLTQGPDVDAGAGHHRPRPQPDVLRISVLDSFDGKTWRPAERDIPVNQRAKGLVARPPGLDRPGPTKEVQATLPSSDSFRSRWLPTPYPVLMNDAPGDWRYDRDTLDFISAADNQTTAGITYRLRGLDLTPSAAELADATPAPASVYTPNTALPRDLRPRSARSPAR